MSATVTCYPQHVARIKGVAVRIVGIVSERVDVFVSECSCGWNGPDRETPAQAAEDGKMHVVRSD